MTARTASKHVVFVWLLGLCATLLHACFYSWWMLGRGPKRIDILTELDGVTFRRAWARRVQARLDARRSVPVIGRDDLIAAKLAAGRLQDLADVAAIEAFAADEKRRRLRRRKRSRRR